MISLLKETITYVFATLLHNAPVLLLGICAAAAIRVYVDPAKLKAAIMKKNNVSITTSVALGAFTPFCACGTMAVIVSMLTTALPWGPIMAFLTSSPLMSPDAFIMYSGIISLKFAIALTVASIIIGVASGYATHFIEENTSFLKNQARFANSQSDISCCTTEIAASLESKSCCSQNRQTHSIEGLAEKYKIKELLQVIYEVGVKQVLLYFSIFAAVGFMIQKFIPAELITNYLGEGNSFAVPLLALVGLPLYVSGSSAIPIINALIAGGASQGALLAFMITGPGTSAGVIAGLTTIMKKRAIALYVAYVLVGGILMGYLYDLLLLFAI